MISGAVLDLGALAALGSADSGCTPLLGVEFASSSVEDAALAHAGVTLTLRGP